ncbi:unnamed protein product [Cochlearia groenlandica]
MAILKNKNITFSLIMICLVVVSPMANAQLGGLGGILGFLNIFNIEGLLGCSINGSITPRNVTSVPSTIPPFPNARVSLVCGGQNVSSTVTNSGGLFSIPTLGLPLSLTQLLTNCRIVVTTPLSTCNSTLPSTGTLTSPVNLAGSIIGNGLNIFQLLPGLFSRVAN